MNRNEAIKYILRNSNHGNYINQEGGSAWASSNIALCKYWGKRDIELNLPVTSSLSVTLGRKGTFTIIKQEGIKDVYVVNGKEADPESKFCVRLRKFLDLFRPEGAHYFVDTKSTVPIAAGFASSACGFAAVVMALDKLYNWQLSKNNLSVLARIGSGSACRSLDSGFVEWYKGDKSDGMDSYAEKLDYTWPELCIGELSFFVKEKSVSSSEGMQRSVNTSSLYPYWSQRTSLDIVTSKDAIKNKDIWSLGYIAEGNAQAMHALTVTSNPAFNYSLPETLVTMKKVYDMRLNNIPVFFTQDAGPNLHLIFLSEHADLISKEFANLDIVMPFN